MASYRTSDQGPDHGYPTLRQAIQAARACLRRNPGWSAEVREDGRTVQVLRASYDLPASVRKGALRISE